MQIMLRIICLVPGSEKLGLSNLRLEKVINEF